MELKDRKYIRNKFAGGKPDWSKTGDAVTGTLNMAGSIYDAHLFDTTADDYMAKYGWSPAHIGDTQYMRYNNINDLSEYNALRAENTKSLFNTTSSGAVAGAGIGTMFAPGIGTAIGAGVGALTGFVGGFLGGKSKEEKQKEEIAKANQKILNFNEMSRFGAITDWMRRDLAEKNGDTRSLLLFSGFSKGKPKDISPDKFTPKMELVHTAQGKMLAPHNSDTELHESIWNEDTKLGHYVDEGPNDTAKSYLTDKDRVFGLTINPETGNPSEKDAEPYIKIIENINKNRPKGTGPLGDASRRTYDLATKGIKENAASYLNHLGRVMDNVLYNKYSCGKPKFKLGKQDDTELEDDTKLKSDYGLNWWGNAIPSFAGMAAGLGLYIQASADKPYKPSTYVPNRFQNKGLALLSSLRIDPYGTVQLLREAEARTSNAINMSGGLSTAQKTLARIASLHGTQQLIANNLNNIQAQNNSYSQHYADALLSQGLGEAQRQQAAKQYDLEYYSKAHAARQQMKQMGIRNFLDSLNMYSANEFKRKNAIANIKLYADRTDVERAELEAWLKGQEKNQPITVNTWTGGVPYVLAPDILDNIPGIVTKPSQAPRTVPGPLNWSKPKNDWLDNTLLKYGW